MPYEEPSNIIQDIINILLIILFVILLLPAIIVLLIFVWVFNIVNIKEEERKEEIKYVTPCGYKFKESDLNKKLKKTKRKTKIR